MTAFDAVLAAALASLVAFQAWLTLRVARSKVYERAQKIRQAQLIWLVPVVGAGLVYSVMRDDEAAERAAGPFVAKTVVAKAGSAKGSKVVKASKVAKTAKTAKTAKASRVASGRAGAKTSA